MNIFAIILARKNSRRLFRKNHLIVKGFSLVERAIIQANKLKFIKKIVLSTDDKFLLKNDYGDKLIIMKRPKKLAQNDTKSVEALLHVSDKLKNNLHIKHDSTLLLQPTSPYRSTKLIEKGFKIFSSIPEKNCSVVSVSVNDYKRKRLFIIEKNRLKLIEKENKNSNKKKYIINGNFYFASINFLRKNFSFYKKDRTIPIEIKNKRHMIDIDTKADYLKAINI